jgi:hypothetical protein
MKASIPKSWLYLPQKEKQIISDLVEKQINDTLDHEEAELQKRWLQLACIVLHRQKDPFGKMRCMAFLAGFKRVYKQCQKFNSDAEIKAWIKTEMDSIFGADGYPSEWVDSLENRGSGAE